MEYIDNNTNIHNNEYIDFYSDNRNAVLFNINKIKPLPDFVKKARIAQKEAIPEGMFAIQEKMAFPCADPASTYLSFAYLQHNKNRVPDESLDYLMKRAYYFDVTDYMKEYLQQHLKWENNLVKEARTKNCAFFDGKKRHFPIASPEHLYMALDKFEKVASDYSIPQRRKIASFIYKKCSEYGETMDNPSVLCYLNNSVDPYQAATNIAARTHSPKLSNMEKRAYSKIAKGLIDCHISDYETFEKVAQLIEKMDRYHGLTNEYGIYYPPAFQSIFNTDARHIEKVAKEMVVIAGEHIPFIKLTTLPPELYAEVLGIDILPEITDNNNKVDPEKLRVIIGTLPLPEQEMLRRYVLQHVGDEL